MKNSKKYKLEYQRKWRKENPNSWRNWTKTNKGKLYLIKRKEYYKNWRIKNKEYYKNWIEKNKEKYYKDKLEYLKKYRKERRKTDIRFRFEETIISGIAYTLKKGVKNRRKWQELVGYTLQDLMTHLEKQFDENMSWNNYGSYWELDHKIPKSWFKYLKVEDQEFKKCWALDNLQPLEKLLNRKKHNCYQSV